MEGLWDQYIEALFEAFPDLYPEPHYAWWAGETNLRAQEYTSEYLIKSREVKIFSEKINIYNTILYPKTGADLPCFGMDLMGFFEKKVIITFDFQHPRENYLFSLGNHLPKCKEGIRFFEPGNHFSEHLYVAKCTASEVNDHLPMFKKYLRVYKNMLMKHRPTGTDTSVYVDFDNYMVKLDPVEGYLASKFGKVQASKFVREFLFSYANSSVI